MFGSPCRTPTIRPVLQHFHFFLAQTSRCDKCPKPLFRPDEVVQLFAAVIQPLLEQLMQTGGTQTGQCAADNNSDGKLMIQGSSGSDTHQGDNGGNPLVVHILYPHLDNITKHQAQDSYFREQVCVQNFHNNLDIENYYLSLRELV